MSLMLVMFVATHLVAVFFGYLVGFAGGHAACMLRREGEH